VISEFLPCQTLDKLFEACGNKFPLKLTKLYMAELAYALVYLNKKKVVHRDLKPQNIMIGPKFHLRICDFGISITSEDTEYDEANEKLEGLKDDFVDKLTITKKSNDSESDVFKLMLTTLPAKDQKAGTEMFMPPEMHEFLIASHQGDVWAFGCIMYQCLTGKHAFLPPNLENKIKEADVNYKPVKDKQARDLLKKCFKVNPFERIQLGYSREQSELINHPFFNGYNDPINKPWTMTPPVPSKGVKAVNELVKSLKAELESDSD